MDISTNIAHLPVLAARLAGRMVKVLADCAKASGLGKPAVNSMIVHGTRRAQQVRLRILTTHKKQNHEAWLRRADLLAGWEQELGIDWPEQRSRASFLFRDFRYAWRLFRISRSYDVLITGSERPALILALLQRFARRRRVPHVLLECMWNLPSTGVAGWRRHLLLRWVADAVASIVVYARHQSHTYARFLGVPAQKFTFVHSHSTLYGRQYPVATGDYVFSGGRTNRDYPNLIEAVRGLPCRVVICAGSAMAVKVHDLPPNVEVVTSFLSEDAFNALMASAAFVVVSLKGGGFELGGRQVFQNAMTMGKAVIVTDESATDYITNGVTGVLVKPGDPLELQRAILTLLHDKDLTRRLGRQAQEASVEFTAERFFDRVFQIAEECARAERHRRAQEHQESMR